MNEQEMMLRKKIEKREKFDIILSYVLIVVLLVCIGLVLYLKFIRKEDEVTPEEYVPNSISLEEIATSLNSSLLANRYLNDNASFGVSVFDETLVVSYVKDDINLSLNVNVVEGELMMNIPSSNTEITEEIYKEITSIICVYYGNEELSCRNVINSVNEESNVEGIRFVNNGESNTVYIDYTRGIDTNSDIVYWDVTQTSIDNTNYTLNLLDTEIRDISINKTDVNISFSGTIERLDEDTSDVAVVVKLYDNSGNLLGENKREFNNENLLEGVSTFEVAFILNDTLTLDNIVNYSIEIVK